MLASSKRWVIMLMFLVCLCVYLYQVKQIWASPTAGGEMGRRAIEGRWPQVHQTGLTECS